MGNNTIAYIPRLTIVRESTIKPSTPKFHIYFYCEDQFQKTTLYSISKEHAIGLIQKTARNTGKWNKAKTHYYMAFGNYFVIKPALEIVK